MKTTVSGSWVQILAFALICAARFPTGATTFAVNPSLDAFVTSGASGSLSENNYGAAGALSVASSSHPQGEFQSVLQFALSGAKSSFDAQFGAGQWTIQSITLQLTATLPNNSLFNASAAGQFSLAWMQNDGWTEGIGTPQAPTATGITFSTLSNFVSGADEILGNFSYGGATNGSSIYALNLTPAFYADVLAGNAVSLRMFAADSVVSYLSDSRSFSTVTARPLLTITAVPEPCPLALGLIGLVGLVAVRCLH